MNELVQIIVICAIAILAIFLNGLYRCKYNSGNDLLMTKLNVGDLDGWSIAHFALFGIIGYRHPDYFVPAMALGVSWELWEEWCGDSRPGWMGGFGDCKLTTDQINTTHHSWWYGRFSDVLINALGFAFGYYLSQSAGRS